MVSQGKVQKEPNCFLYLQAGYQRNRGSQYRRRFSGRGRLLEISGFENRLIIRKNGGYLPVLAQDRAVNHRFTGRTGRA